MTVYGGLRPATMMVTLMEKLALTVCVMLTLMASPDWPIGWLISSNRPPFWTPPLPLQLVSSPPPPLPTPPDGPKLTKSLWSSGRLNHAGASAARRSRWFLYAEAKGVAGLGKAGGDGTGGSDKAGQQVPPEVYNALTYAGSAFLLTLSVPLILYGLNKLLNKIEDCFGCGPSSKARKRVQAEPQPAPPVSPASPPPPPPPPPQLQTQLPQHHLNQLHQASIQAQLFTSPAKYNLSSDNEGDNGRGNNNGHKADITNNFNGNLPVQQQQQHQLHQQQKQKQKQQQQQQQQQQKTLSTVPNSIPMTLPFAPQLNYKSSAIQANLQHPLQAQVVQQQQQPYIISSQHL